MAEKLVSLKSKGSASVEVAPEAPEDFFPLSLYLGSEEIQKLKLSGASLNDEMMLVARVRVTSVSTRDDENGKTEDMRLVLTEGRIEKQSKSLAERIFGSE